MCSSSSCEVLLTRISIRLFAALLLLLVSHQAAADANAPSGLILGRAIRGPWPLTVPPCRAEVEPRRFSFSPAESQSVLEQNDAQPVHPTAVEHSEGYETRKKIHKIASFATLPLFATEVVLGQSLYNNSARAGALRSAHGLVGTAIVGLFAVNTVTGLWNLLGEDRKDPQGRTLRFVHGLLMLAADVGFVATSRTGPNSRSPRQALTFEANKVTHRNLAIASISVGTAGYLVMLFGYH